jgi:hypothetical protein
MSKAPDYPLTDKPIYCGHCGRELPMFVICNGVYNYSDKWHTGDLRGYINYYNTYNIFVCPVCHEATVIQKERDSEGEYEFPDVNGNIIVDYAVRETTLYPAKQTFQYAPTEVVQSYETAARLLHAEPLACAVFVGRTLEFLCKDRKASGRNLDQMLKDLASKGEIPQSILDMALSLKGFRNVAAHASSVEVSKEDADLLLKICEVIIEYVYEAAQMLEEVKERYAKLTSK